MGQLWRLSIARKYIEKYLFSKNILEFLEGHSFYPYLNTIKERPVFYQTLFTANLSAGQKCKQYVLEYLLHQEAKNLHLIIGDERYYLTFTLAQLVKYCIDREEYDYIPLPIYWSTAFDKDNFLKSKNIYNWILEKLFPISNLKIKALPECLIKHIQYFKWLIVVDFSYPELSDAEKEKIWMQLLNLQTQEIQVRIIITDTNQSSRNICERAQYWGSSEKIATPTMITDGLEPVDNQAEEVGTILTPFTLNRGNILKNKNKQILPGSYSQALNLPNDYHKYITTINSLMELNEYEYAQNLYWKVLYYSGYRELWQTRLTLSKQLLKLSISNRDWLTSGKVLTKGISYVFITQEKTLVAKKILDKAYKYFSKSHSKWGNAICWNYLGDMYKDLGNLNAAIRCYNQSISMLHKHELEQYQIYLKSLFVEICNYNLKSQRRIIALKSLINQFASIGDYREGLVKIEIARSLHCIESEEALKYAQEAYTLFNQIVMPRNTKKAKRILCSIQEELSR